MVSQDLLHYSMLVTGSIGFSIHYVMALVKIDATNQRASNYIWLTRFALSFSLLSLVYLVFGDQSNAMTAALVCWLIQGGIQLIVCFDGISVSKAYKSMKPDHHHALRRATDRQAE